MGSGYTEDRFSNSLPEDHAAFSYEICVEGRLDSEFWSTWFGGIPCGVNAERNETLLFVPVVDQAELYGLLSRLRNRGLALISVRRVSPPCGERSGPGAAGDGSG